jgi:hypothetical protein
VTDFWHLLSFLWFKRRRQKELLRAGPIPSTTASSSRGYLHAETSVPEARRSPLKKCTLHTMEAHVTAMTETDTLEDARIVQVGSDDAPLEVGPKTLLVLLWTSAFAVSFMAEIVFGVVTSVAHATWLATGTRASSWSAVLWPLLISAMPLPGVVVFTSVWWISLRRRGSRSGPKASVLVVLALVLGTVIGAFWARSTWSL